ncbi:MAG: hypothetical protein M1830_005045, partial [Pleopsidium flavum]
MAVIPSNHNIMMHLKNQNDNAVPVEAGSDGKELDIPMKGNSEILPGTEEHPFYWPIQLKGFLAGGRGDASA